MFNSFENILIILPNTAFDARKPSIDNAFLRSLALMCLKAENYMQQITDI